MDPTDREGQVAIDVDAVLQIRLGPTLWAGDFTKTFRGDLKIATLGQFAGILNQFADQINNDGTLNPAQKFVIDDKLDRPGEQPFAEAFYPRTVGETVRRISDTLGLPPYNV